MRYKISGFVDLKFVRAGVLAVEREGQPTGMPFVAVASDTVMGRELARQYLARYCSTTDLAWEYGWEPIGGVAGEGFKELNLYPSPHYCWDDFEPFALG